MGFFISFLNTFNMKPYREKHNRLSSYCPWAFFVGKHNEGIVLLKSGALMRVYSFVCPDLGSASVESINAVSYFFNEAVKRLGNGWCAQFESQRAVTTDYPGSRWSNIAGYLIDRRRQELFTGEETHFVNRYFLTLTCRLKSDIYAKTNSLLYKKDDKEAGEREGYYNLEICKKEIGEFRDETDACISHLIGRVFIEPLNNDDCATYLHSSVSANFHPVATPKRPMLFDHYITDQDLEIGTTLKLGDTYIPIVAVRDFPAETYPAMLSALNGSHIEYRWSIRWIARGKQEAAKDIEKYQKRFYGSRKSWGQALAESVGNFESNREDPAALAFEKDTNTAKVELASDLYSFGYYTANIMVWDTSYAVAIEKARYMVGLVNSSGFNAKIETANAFNAFLSMQPGNAYANVRRPVISSGNLSHIIPLSSLWSGMARNDWTKECFGCAAPLLICSTASRIAFFLNLNVGDLGHAFVFGPAGAGKSTLLCLMESQFLKYRNANVIILDKDKSARSITMAAGGVYAEPGGEDVAFQPLRDLETETDLSWAAEFIRLLLEMQGISCDAVMSEAVAAALKQIRSDKAPERRTLSTFQQYVNYTSPQTGLNEIRTGIQPYTINGEYGRIFDAADTRLALSKWVMIEMGTLMKMGAAAVTPALMFLFRFIEKMYTKPNGDPTGDPTLLVLDEAWVFLDNDYFAKKIEEWLVTLRKKRVFCVFATQEVSKAANSKLRTTIVSQCLTKIYLADPSAQSAIVAEYYRLFGLEDNEIAALSRARMKRDYFYKSPKGARLFELGLDEFQLALLSPDHALLDGLEQEYGRNSRTPLAAEILKRKGVTGWEHYLNGEDV
jgi:type IV secretion system protein VirB4